MAPFVCGQVDGIRQYPDLIYPGFSVMVNGLVIRVESTSGVILEYDGEWMATVRVPEGHMTGLCGNNDGNPDNDLVTKEGVDVSQDPSGHSLFGNSWAVYDNENPT